MSLAEIRSNVDRLEEIDKEVLIRYINELLLKEKRQENKIMSLRSEIKFSERQLKKIKNLIDKSLKARERGDVTWKEKNQNTVN